MRRARIINERMLINSYLNLKSVSKTTSEYKINRNRVKDILKKHSIEIIENKGGAPKKVGEYEKKKILKNFKNNEFNLASEGVEFLNDLEKIKVSGQSIRNILKESGIKCKKAVKNHF